MAKDICPECGRWGRHSPKCPYVTHRPKSGLPLFADNVLDAYERVYHGTTCPPPSMTDMRDGYLRGYTPDETVVLYLNRTN